jgi:hypothetical protein
MFQSLKLKKELGNFAKCLQKSCQTVVEYNSSLIYD